MKPELDFALESHLRTVPYMTRTELISFIELLVDNNRRTYEILSEFQTIALEQSEIIAHMVSINKKLETKIESLSRESQA
jgi:hypothetical protein